MFPFSIYSHGKEVTGKISVQFLNEGVGIFESLRAYHGKIFRLDEHLRRFLESAKTAGYWRPLKIVSLRKEICSALEAFQRRGLSQSRKPQPDLFLRISLWDGRFFVLIGERRHAQELYEKGVHLKTSSVRRTLSHAQPPQVKTSAYQNSVLASLEPSSDLIYEWVFLDRDGYVTEVRIGNIFRVKDGSLYTPPVTGILHGVTRRVVIECAVQLRIPWYTIPLTRHDFYNADEAFLTNTSWEILPIASLDKRNIGTKLPGIKTCQLQQRFKKIVQIECQ